MYLEEQLKIHPAMQAQDAIKLCFQAAYGAEHLLGDIAKVREYFDAEFEKTPAKDGPLYEKISYDVCRVNLASWKSRGLEPTRLFNLFILSASLPRDEGSALFAEYIQQIKASPQYKENADWQEYINNYVVGEHTPVHHSDEYRAAEAPAYRVVSGSYIRLLPIFDALKPEHLVIAIDGPAGSGKSTTAAQLAKIINAGVVHMDDFFLTPELRTAERLDTPGGNIHHERFAQEVLSFLHKPDLFEYRVFDCKTMQFAQPREVLHSKYRLIEGAYSCHPILGDYADIKIFIDISPDEQHKRILKRDGAEVAEKFASEWIPMEEKYFKTYKIKESACVVI